METVAAIVEAHRSHKTKPVDVVARSFARIRAYGDAAVFITLREEAETLAEAEELAKRGSLDRPLYGVPIAVKDNIDVAGLPTTAACEAFAYRAAIDATVVAKLRRAGAIVIGKTNLDQFATGLVGTRSPYGIPRNPLNRRLIPGGSSSGSAVAVAAGLVPLALGTDTAGSGRIPALTNNIVGLKPSRGMVSTFGVVPACRTLDCVSVFALTVDDAFAALTAMAGPDPRDPYARPLALGAIGALPPALRIGVPPAGQRMFFGDQRAARDYGEALERLTGLGATTVEIDIEPFYEAARLLYEGPWLAERYAAIRSVIASSPQAVHPVTLEIIREGARLSAADAFTAFYRLEQLRRTSDATFRQVDVLALPTAPTVYTVEQILADPIALNARLGTYTNFVNLLDLCGVAVPSALGAGPTPFGISILSPRGNDALVATVGRAYQAAAALPLGALNVPMPVLEPLKAAPASDEVALAVVGAHLSGMPLNHELRQAGARFLEATQTSADYRLHVLPAARPEKPGLLRVAHGRGTAIEVEVWALPFEGFGRFVAAVPAPLSIGTVVLADGRAVKGFLVEAEAVAGARDISALGGWRAYVQQGSHAGAQPSAQDSLAIARGKR
jgi:allophanate hydrolase